MAFVKNAKEIDTTQQSYDLLPKGHYSLILEEYEDKTTANGNMLSCRFVIADGEYADRIVYQNYNYENTNASAVEIAARDMARLVKACGVEYEDIDVEELDQCIGVPFMGEIKISKSKNPKYDDSNEIKSYWSDEEYAEGVDDGSIKERIPAPKEGGETTRRTPPAKKPAGKKPAAKSRNSLARKPPPKKGSTKPETPFEGHDDDERDGIDD